MVLPWAAKQLVKEVEGIFERAESQTDLEAQADYAKYLVIRLSGLVEQVLAEIVIAHVRAQASSTVLSYATSQIKRFQNPNAERVIDLVRAFDRRWAQELDESMSDSERNALGSVRTQRNRIAHGQPSTVSLVQVTGYFDEIKRLLVRAARPF